MYDIGDSSSVVLCQCELCIEKLPGVTYYWLFFCQEQRFLLHIQITAYMDMERKGWELYD
jgi:hypothetical protein